MEDYVKLLMFLVDEYHLKFSAQTFNKCPFGAWTTKAYSFYNNTGCFTIAYLLGREDLDFYFSSAFSNDYNKLCEELLNVWIDEPQIWNKHQKWIFGIKDPFFWWKKKKIFNALAETIKEKINRTGEFYGIKIKGI